MEENIVKGNKKSGKKTKLLIIIGILIVIVVGLLTCIYLNKETDDDNTSNIKNNTNKTLNINDVVGIYKYSDTLDDRSIGFDKIEIQRNGFVIFSEANTKSSKYFNGITKATGSIKLDGTSGIIDTIVCYDEFDYERSCEIKLINLSFKDNYISTTDGIYKKSNELDISEGADLTVEDLVGDYIEILKVGGDSSNQAELTIYKDGTAKFIYNGRNVTAKEHNGEYNGKISINPNKISFSMLIDDGNGYSLGFMIKNGKIYFGDIELVKVTEDVEETNKKVNVISVSKLDKNKYIKTYHNNFDKDAYFTLKDDGTADIYFSNCDSKPPYSKKTISYNIYERDNGSYLDLEIGLNDSRSYQFLYDKNDNIILKSQSTECDQEKGTIFN